MTVIHRTGVVGRVFRYRPHHFLCTLGFQGKGYSPGFVQNFSTIVGRLREKDGEQQLIEVVDVCDDICQPCPRRSKQLCQQEKTIAVLDAGHSQVLGLQAGQRISWGEAKDLLKERMSIADFHRVCSACSWKSLGYCEGALRSLQSEGEILSVEN